VGPGGGNQHHFVGALGPGLGIDLRNDAAEGVSDDVGSANSQRIQQQHDVISEVGQGVTTVGLAGAAVAAQIDQDESKAL
jgi:hypothetical protein